MESKNIHQAIFNIQKEITSVKKNAKNPFFKSNYANLEQVLETIMPEIQKNGLVIVQKPIQSEKVGTLLLRTEIIHVESSESVFCELELPLVKNDPQSAGSAITYARRYSLVSLLSLGSEDDDGEKAMPREKKVKRNLKDISDVKKAMGYYPDNEFLKSLGEAINKYGKLTDNQRLSLGTMLIDASEMIDN